MTRFALFLLAFSLALLADFGGAAERSLLARLGSPRTPFYTRAARPMAASALARPPPGRRWLTAPGDGRSPAKPTMAPPNARRGMCARASSQYYRRACAWRRRRRRSRRTSDGGRAKRGSSFSSCPLEIHLWLSLVSARFISCQGLPHDILPAKTKRRARARATRDCLASSAGGATNEDSQGFEASLFGVKLPLFFPSLSLLFPLLPKARKLIPRKFCGNSPSPPPPRPPPLPPPPPKSSPSAPRLRACGPANALAGRPGRLRVKMALMEMAAPCAMNAFARETAEEGARHV